MRKVLFYSLLLILGLVGSQFAAAEGPGRTAVQIMTMAALAFIMIHVGYEFEIDKSKPLSYAWDYVVAAAAASLPWILCALYFVLVMGQKGAWRSGGVWQGALLMGLFAAPTSAGVLFSMLAAAGLAGTWVFGKARVLAIFDDLNTLLLLIPLKMVLIGLRWQLFAVIAIMIVLLRVAWRHLHARRWPVGWRWIMGYAVAVTAVCEGTFEASRYWNKEAPIQIEVLLPAFVLGCVLARPEGADCHVNDAVEGSEEGPEGAGEQRVSTVVSAVFMVLVGLSMPPIAVMAGRAGDFPGWGMIAVHVIVVTALSNLGKLFPAVCYRREATVIERVALAVGMFPRGEVGAGVLVVALSYGIAGAPLVVAVLSLTLNLLCTGVFIVVVKKLLGRVQAPDLVVGRPLAASRGRVLSAAQSGRVR